MPAPTLQPATTLDEVIERINTIIDWSIVESNRLGYFAALYKRITAAVKAAVADGQFDDGPRMARLDVAFANRYFDAFNGYSTPAQFAKPTRSWQVTFDAATNEQPIMLQHMLAGINAHIGLDLGIAAQAIDTKTSVLKDDYDRINAVLASQVNGVVNDIDELSPALADIHAVLTNNEVFLIDEAVIQFRDDAWRFARLLEFEPRFAQPLTVGIRDFDVAKQGGLIYHPPNVVGISTAAIDAVAAQECRDVRHNITVLDEIAARPATSAATSKRSRARFGAHVKSSHPNPEPIPTPRQS